MGVASVSAGGRGGLGVAEWGVFGNVFVDRTKILSVDSEVTGPMMGGGSSSAGTNLIQRYP